MSISTTYIWGSIVSLEYAVHGRRFYSCQFDISKAKHSHNMCDSGKKPDAHTLAVSPDMKTAGENFDDHFLEEC